MTKGWRLSVERHGTEREPVVVIDGFAPDPNRFLDDAAFLAFGSMGEHYPGVRAAVAPAMLRDSLAALASVAGEVFGAERLVVADAFYSMVTTPPAALTPIQRLPHFDTVDRGRLALLHFLSRDEGSGTAFYRHRTTTYETVDGERLEAYRKALDADLKRHGLPPPAYIGGDTPVFEQLAAHGGSFNRAILYRSCTLHCALIPEGMVLTDDPATGRLTVNTFLDTRS